MNKILFIGTTYELGAFMSVMSLVIITFIATVLTEKIYANMDEVI